MPVTKSASKKLKADKTKEKRNNTWRNLFKRSLKVTKKNPTLVNISKTTGIIDKLAKNNLIHKNKAARIKSSLSKLVLAKKKPAEAKKKK